MKTIITTTNVYSFNELSAEAQNQAIDKLSDINVDYEWWDGTYMDAERVGIEINSFDIDRGSYCKGSVKDTEQTAHDIIKEHGETCNTYKTASSYLKERDELIEGWGKDANGEYVDEDELDQKLDDMGEEFERSILEDYRIILSNEYDYLTSKEAIIETINSNEYEFTEDGELY